MKIPPKIPPESLVAIIDSREQLAYDLSPMQMRTAALESGDYSLAGCENLVTIERKSLSDFLCCVTRERPRFEKELRRMSAFPTKCVIIEASWHQIAMGGWRSQVMPASVQGSILSWQSTYSIPFLLAGDRREGEAACRRILVGAANREWRRLRTLALGMTATSTEGVA